MTDGAPPPKDGFASLLAVGSAQQQRRAAPAMVSLAYLPIGTTHPYPSTREGCGQPFCDLADVPMSASAC